MGEITARLDSLWPAWDACRADPPRCDINAITADYFAPGARPAAQLRGAYDYIVASNRRTIDLDKVQRFVAAINVTGTDASSEVCERDAAIAVGPDGSVIDDSIGLFRLESVWSKIDGKWMIVGGTTYKITEAGDAICDAYFK